MIVPLAENVALKKEVVRKPYTSSTKTSDTSYEDGDVVAFSNFLAKVRMRQR